MNARPACAMAHGFNATAIFDCISSQQRYDEKYKVLLSRGDNIENELSERAMETLCAQRRNRNKPKTFGMGKQLTDHILQSDKFEYILLCPKNRRIPSKCSGIK